jgi:hypothetical protein
MIIIARPARLLECLVSQHKRLDVQVGTRGCRGSSSPKLAEQLTFLLINRLFKYDLQSLGGLVIINISLG